MKAVLALLLVTVAVGSAAAASPAITPAQLALMPLPKTELGPAAIGLPLDPQSGVQTNKDAADDAFAATAADFTRLGRLTGYELDYDDRAGKALVSGRGLLEVDTGVELYRDSAAARHGLAFWRKDTERAATIKTSGLSIVIRPFSVGALGDASYAFTDTGYLKGKRPVYGAEILFQLGQLLAGVSVSAAQPAQSRPLAEVLASKLAARIRLVLDRKVKGPPVRLPGKVKAGPPPHGPDLAALALTTEDLGSGTVTHQGYKLDTDFNPISEYEREFSPAGDLFSLDEEVALFHSPTEASYAFGILAEVLSSTRALRTYIAADRHTDLASMTASPVAGYRVGDESRALLATVRGKNGLRVHEGFVLLRTGSTTEFVIVASPASMPVQRGALLQVGRLAADRARRGLKQ